MINPDFFQFYQITSYEDYKHKTNFFVALLFRHQKNLLRFFFQKLQIFDFNFQFYQKLLFFGSNGVHFRKLRKNLLM